MTARNRRLINVLSTGTLVMLVTLVMLFWGRWYCHLLRLDAGGQGTRRVQVSPMGLFPSDKADDPNLSSPSQAMAELRGIDGLFSGLGTPQYVRSHLLGHSDSPVYQWQCAEGRGEMWLYFDSSLGLMVYAAWATQVDPNGIGRRRYMTQYAGPEGVAAAPSETLGRFLSPISGRYSIIDPQIVYDETYRRFFAIHWKDGLV